MRSRSVSKRSALRCLLAIHSQRLAFLLAQTLRERRVPRRFSESRQGSLRGGDRNRAEVPASGTSRFRSPTACVSVKTRPAPQRGVWGSERRAYLLTQRLCLRQASPTPVKSATRQPPDPGSLAPETFRKAPLQFDFSRKSSEIRCWIEVCSLNF
jgi:hypothetical protein